MNRISTMQRPDERPLFFEEPNANDSEVRTTSKLVVTWLTLFKGYRVKRRAMEPQPRMFGRVKQAKIWLLEAPTSATDIRKR